ncbi:unnamed protein product, partial [Vitis vinifera]
MCHNGRKWPCRSGVCQLRAYKVHMAVYDPCSHNHSFSSDDLGANPNDHACTMHVSWTRKWMITCGYQFTATATIPTIIAKPTVNTSKYLVGNMPIATTVNSKLFCGRGPTVYKLLSP